MNKLVVLKAVSSPIVAKADEEVIHFDLLKEWIANGLLWRLLFTYREVELCCYRVQMLTKPFLTYLLLHLLSCGRVEIRDQVGFQKRIKLGCLFKHLSQLFMDWFSISRELRRVDEKLSEEISFLGAKTNKLFVNPSAEPLYLRTDLWFGLRSGGSVGHIAGVLNNLHWYTGKPLFFTTDRIPTVQGDIQNHFLHPTSRYWDFNELPSLVSNSYFEQQVLEVIGNFQLSFIYQRYSLNNYCGVKLADHFKVPFVLEYNGSEIWINRHWGTPLKHEALSEKIELLNLQAADLIVVVSQPMKDELIGRNIDADKILVNPNGVEADRYSPDINGDNIRKRYGLDDKLVIGFIGTFGPWHGTEVLVEAFGRLVHEDPQLKERLRLLLIGDGSKMTLVKEIIARYGLEQLVVLTGTVPQEEGPEHLAACDMLASPHVPNPDGTPFFGSPTKLFEYMAMAKGIVASDLDQIGEILEHQRTAWLVKPGDSDSLKTGLKILVDNPGLRETLGRAAREEVIQRYTWQEHTRKIMEKLKERCA